MIKEVDFTLIYAISRCIKYILINIDLTWWRGVDSL